MAWFMRERRGISWTDQTLASISAPPLPLLVFFGLVMILLSIPIVLDLKAQMERAMVVMRIILYLSAVGLVLILHATMRLPPQLVIPVSRAQHCLLWTTDAFNVFSNLPGRRGSGGKSHDGPEGLYLSVGGAVSISSNAGVPTTG
ncbi:hypothetical protein RJ639_014307 [Escallonia herrerae]|uniref:Uncharacterized protein n=1 Tax=Escallonia herrerae TaxID=1293975 RepID=A0AA89AM60_9ASTE|nr:hypothetical protein RJ639_014307 [Escallonia herrerae]